MINAIKKWGNKPLSMPVFYVFVGIIVLCYLVESLFCKIYDSDMFFMIATGREIIEHGIPYTNIWTIDESVGFVAQQWLYDVIIAIADKFEYVGFISLVLVQFIGLLLLMNHFFNIKKISSGFKLISMSIVVFYSQLYLFSLRPELITMILVLVECIALEHYYESGKWQWLLFLPLTMIAEINFHASMWPIHFAVLLAYIVPTFFIKGVKDRSVFKKWKPILAFTPITAVSMMLNPYGLDAVLYIIKSFKAHTFNYVNIVELDKAYFLSAVGLTITLSILILCACFKWKTLESVTLNITLGFGFMGIMALRNNVFAIFMLLYLFRNLSEYLMTKEINWRKDVKNQVLPFLLLGVFVFGMYCANSIYLSFFKPSKNGEGFDVIHEYISENYDSDTHIFTGFNNGAYMEWKGLKNIYIDARPELYTSEFTGNKNILGDYSRYCIYGFSPVPDGRDNMFVTKAEMDKWFYSYDFDFVIVAPMAEPYLASYMMNNTDYKPVDDRQTGVYVLYEKVEKGKE